VVTRTVQQVGGSFGTAVLAVILTATLATRPGAPAGAFDIAFWWAIGFSAVAVLLSLWLPGSPHPEPVPAPAAPATLTPQDASAA
jgi:hypothetical protein